VDAPSEVQVINLWYQAGVVLFCTAHFDEISLIYQSILFLRKNILFLRKRVGLSTVTLPNFFNTVAFGYRVSLLALITSNHGAGINKFRLSIIMKF